MLKPRYGILLGCALLALEGCTLVEVRSKSKVGPEFRHNGPTRTNSIRWYAQQGFEFVWRDKDDNKITSGITYLRRDTDNGDSSRDNGVWLDFSFPVWRAEGKSESVAFRIESLERRIAALEAGRSDGLVHAAPDPEALKTQATSKEEDENAAP